MKKIIVELTVDENEVMKVSGQDDLDTAIETELHWLNECMSLESWDYADEKEIPTKEGIYIPTPIGDITVTVKGDSDYPGIYVDLKGNDWIEDTTLAMVEYDSQLGKIRTHVYGDSMRDEPSVSVEHGNYQKKSIEDMIKNADKKKGTDKPGVNKAEVEKSR